MTIIKNVTDFPENFFGFHPEDLSPDEKNRPLGKIFIKLQKLRNDLGLKCILIPGFAFKSISIINIEQDEKLSANHTVQHHPSSNTARIL